MLVASAAADTYQGALTLAEGSFFEDVDPDIVYAGEISYSVRFFVNEFVDSEAIYAYTQVTNNSDTELKYTFYAAFLDADENLVATSRHTTSLKPGVETQLGGMYSEIPDDEWRVVVSFKFTVWKL